LGLGVLRHTQTTGRYYDKALLRLSVGLEAECDLLDDLARALQTAGEER
jgi:cystathionine beta-lyase/cystathionine gamma-synthase